MSIGGQENRHIRLQLRAAMDTGMFRLPRDYVVRLRMGLHGQSLSPFLTCHLNLPKTAVSPLAPC